MTEIIHSISFHENKINWIQTQVAEKKIVIQRVVESLLPLVINLDNLNKSTTLLQIANHLTSLVKPQETDVKNVRFLIPAKFTLIKKIWVDQFIPQDNYAQLAEAELNYLLGNSREQYLVYVPEYLYEQEQLREILVVGIRKSVFEFIKQIAQEAKFSLQQININCFTLDELYHRLYPNDIGQTLLVNFTERGYELVISDEKNFLDVSFRPYSSNLEGIEQMDNDEIFASFNSMLEAVQSASPGEAPLYSISQIYLFGNYFQDTWLEALQSRTNIPLRILNPVQAAEALVVAEDPAFNPAEAYRFAEPLSNLF